MRQLTSYVPLAADSLKLPKMLDFDFNDFWIWFEKNSSNLNSDNYDTTLLNKLDNIVSSWGFGWEIGPGFTKENSLTISPNGNRELLVQTSEIVDKAPKLTDWEFYSSKQPKDNWDKAQLDNLKIDASDWTYILFKYPNDKIEILLKAENLKQLDTSTKELAVDLVLTNLLGEKRKIEDLDFIEIVDQYENQNGITQLKFLPVHMDKIKNGT